MLYDVTHYPPRIITVEECDENEWVDTFETKTDPRTVNRTYKTFDEAIEAEVVESKKRIRLTWTKTGAVIGFNSPRPVRDVKHVWDAVQAVQGTVGRPPVFTMGAIMKSRIVRRDETWLLYRRETGAVDPIDGTDIRVAEYWIDEDFPEKLKKQKQKESKKSDYDTNEPQLGAMALALEAAKKAKARK